MKPNEVELFVEKDQKRLQCGYTTGSCSAGAVRAAFEMLLGGRRVEIAAITTPSGYPLALEVEEAVLGQRFASCAIRKNAGDDPDVTHGALIFASVQVLTPEEELSFAQGAYREEHLYLKGGKGIGMVTKPGLACPVGYPAINPVPRQMIFAEARAAAENYKDGRSFGITLWVPEGEELAKRTFNPNLGIEGGISILGTTGIVEPMSESALKETIRTEIRQRKAEGYRVLSVTPGNYGQTFLKEQKEIPWETAVKCSNFIGDTIDMAVSEGFQGLLLTGHIGKLVKLAGGMFETHSRYGDCRMELLASLALLEGATGDEAREILACMTTEAALDQLAARGLKEKVMKRLIARLTEQLARKSQGKITCGVVVFSGTHGWLGESENAEALRREIAKEQKKE